MEENFSSMKDIISRKYVYRIKAGKNMESYISNKDQCLYIAESNYSKWDIDYNRIRDLIPIFTEKAYDFRNFCVTKGQTER